MKTLLRSLFLLSALSTFAPAFATDTDSAPASALRGFFTAVANKDYASAWAAFTRHSQEGIVKATADSEHMDIDEVRKLFITNDQSIRDGFWESFRQSSQAEKFINLAMASGGRQADADDSVVITLPNHNSATLLMYYEDGAWKVGWMETFFPGNKIPVQ